MNIFVENKVIVYTLIKGVVTQCWKKEALQLITVYLVKYKHEYWFINCWKLNKFRHFLVIAKIKGELSKIWGSEILSKWSRVPIHIFVEMGPDPTQAYFWPTVNKGPTRPWPRYILTWPEAIFFYPKQKNWKI